MTEENELTTNQSFAGQLLKISQVAQLLRVNEATVRKWARAGLLESVELPTRPGTTRKFRRIKGEGVDKILGHRS